MIKNVKIYPEKAIYVKRRKILYYVCEENDEDISKRNSRLKEQAKINKKSVVRISASGTMKFFDSVKDAAKASSTSYSSVSKCINGKQTSAGGYEFRRGE